MSVENQMAEIDGTYDIGGVRALLSVVTANLGLGAVLNLVLDGMTPEEIDEALGNRSRMDPPTHYAIREP